MDKEVEENYLENGVGSENGAAEMVEYAPSNPQTQSSLDKLNFADMMQFADFGPELAPNQSLMPSEDESHLLKFHALDYRMFAEEGRELGAREDGEEEDGMFLENNSLVQRRVLGGAGDGGSGKVGGAEAKNHRRKRPRTMKTSEEVESQRMTHIAVERNRRRQMNDHLRVLRSLMPGSYVQRGDQASIIGGAIEFVRELEQLLQCLESQKRRRLFGTDEAPRNMTDAPRLPLQQPQQQPLFNPFPLPGGDNMRVVDVDPSGTGLAEDMAENKSCLADIEVRLMGLDAMIKILSRRRPGQLIKTITTLEDLQFTIVHTNITTIEQTVLYSFSVKIGGEMRCTAEDIANSVQQILSFIDTSTI